MDETIKRVLEEHGKLNVAVTEISSDDDLYRKGLTSHATVNVMLGLEDEFDIEFPNRLLRKSTFGSVRAIREALTDIGVSAEV